MVILGMLVMLYPVVSTMLNNYATTKAAKEYAQLEKSVPQEVKDTQWEDAQRYNAERTQGPLLDPWLDQIDESNPDYASYLEKLNATDAMARLIIPSIKVDLPIYHGTSDETLQKGLGHLYGSDLPVGGEGTHAIITGHTGLTNATLFDRLSDVKENDVFYVQVSGHKLKYQVDQIKVVLPTETDDLKVQEGKDLITMITCTPYGINTHRLLVRGHRVEMDPSEEAIFDQTQSPGMQWWMYALIALVILIALGLLWWLRKARSVVKPQEGEAHEN
ncbi:fimbrial associated sortase [Corynebacterium vitaeruminis DSM 20294]|uniref:Fimbrial associated sortase n=1 Tax=Corynebacterium vitaeruminis DSM 20294 TaxID=1224164 RepID=W5Y454_9CORY|nr:fimbrial associated sortase [Corynebacterium vitaeruminis DSM 20294]